MGVIIKQLELGPMANFTYLVGDGLAKECAVIDPGWQTDDIIDESRKLDIAITHILLTHTHFDHINGAKRLAKECSAKIFVHQAEALAEANTIDDNDVIHIGNIDVKTIHTPGHTKGSVCYLAGKMLFTGDTLFVDGIGRTDLEDSDPEEMFKSLQRLAALSDDTIIYPGHNYGAERTSTIGEQKKRNPYMKCNSAGEFLRY